jgi:ketosteroid isomerase-like protein
MTDLETTLDANTAVVADLYAAFGRGDVAAILDLLAEDVSWDGDWADHSAQRAPIDELLVPRHGRAQVGEFFAALAAYSVHEFQVLDLMASDRQVVAQIVIDLSYPNGGRIRDEELHLWTFGPRGEITALRHYVDTAKHLAAACGEDTTA